MHRQMDTGPAMHCMGPRWYGSRLSTRSILALAKKATLLVRDGKVGVGLRIIGHTCANGLMLG